MQPRYIAIILSLSVLGVLAAINSATLATPIRLNLLFGRVEAPLGIVFLAVAGLLVLLYQMVLLRTETVRMLEGRRASKAIEEARGLADKAESSRIEALRQTVADGFATLNRRLETLENRDGMTARRERPGLRRTGVGSTDDQEASGGALERA